MEIQVYVDHKEKKVIIQTKDFVGEGIPEQDLDKYVAYIYDENTIIHYEGTNKDHATNIFNKVSRSNPTYTDVINADFNEKPLNHTMYTEEQVVELLAWYQDFKSESSLMEAKSSFPKIWEIRRQAAEDWLKRRRI